MKKIIKYMAMQFLFKVISFHKLPLYILIILLIDSYFIITQENNLKCDTKKIWSIKYKPHKRLTQKINILISALSSNNLKKRDITFNKLRRIIPYALQYVKKIYPNIDATQKYYLKGYYLGHSGNVSKMGIMCVKNSRFMWYAIIDDKILLVGNDKKIVDSFPIYLKKLKTFSNEMDKLEIRNTACDLRDNSFTKYAIWITDSIANCLVYTNDFTYNCNFFYIPILSSLKKDRFVLTNFIGKIYQDGKEVNLPGKVKYALFSPDSNRIVYIIKRNDKYMVIADNMESKEYDYIENIAFSHDSKKIAYIAQKNNKYLAVIDGKEGKKYDAIIGDIVFSPDSKKYAYIARKGKNWFVVINDIEGKKYSNIKGSIVFSPDSKKIAYKAMLDKKWTIILNNKKSEKYDLVDTIIFSPDSKQLAYTIRMGNYMGVVINEEKKNMQHRFIDSDSLKFSPDGKRYAYIANGNNVIVDGIQNGEYIYVPSNSVIFSPDSKKFAYKAFVKNKWVFVLDGIISNEFTNVLDIGFTTDSKKFIAFVEDEGKTKIFVNNKEIKGFDLFSNFSIFDGKILFLGTKFNSIYEVTCK